VPNRKIVPLEPVILNNAILMKRRLEFHKIALESLGVTYLSELVGTLQISGNVIPTPGLLFPDNIHTGHPTTTFSRAKRLKKGATSHTWRLENIGGVARILQAKPFPANPHPRPYPHPYPHPIRVATAYWAADWIKIEDDTQVILMQPNSYLVIIANRITIGKNVTITWEMPQRTVPIKPSYIPPPPATPPKSTYMKGTPGRPGRKGTDGGPGHNGTDGPEIEIWTLKMTGTPDIVIPGQDGFTGGEGGDGGPGGNGAAGKDWTPGPLGDCKNGPGNGGRGGRGGRGGDGGPGGDGGDGGRFSLYAPQEIINNFINSFLVHAAGGRNGYGGKGGKGGKGGRGGHHGKDRHWPHCPTDFGQDGQPGPDGASGHRGEEGSPGKLRQHPFSFQVIEEEDFLTALSKPAIHSLTPYEVRQGDTVTVSGTRFSDTDVVVLNGVECATTVSSDTLITFIVGNVSGGNSFVQVKQSDGTLSNKVSIQILPTIDYIVSEFGEIRSDSTPPGHFQPSSTIIIKGTGFAPGAYIKILDQYIQDVTYEDNNTLRANLIRPISTQRNVDGEEIDIQVLLQDDFESNSLKILLDTYHIVVFGDSIQWGQGLRDDLKFSSLVEQFIINHHGDIGVYRNIYAHSGAIIGVGDNNDLPSLGEEVPYSYPTILQQVDSFSGEKDKVDLILLDGGINDIGVNEIVSPVANSDLKTITHKYCYEDLKYLLERVTGKFNHATIIVTGYYQIVSEDSNLEMLALLLTGVGVSLLGLPTSMVVGHILTQLAKDKMVERCATFAERSRIEISNAIDEVNGSLPGGPRVYFAQPAFKPQNAIFASDTWLWGVNPPLSPQDDDNSGGVASSREAECNAAGNRAPSYCKIASIGHPNVAGAQEYARKIIELL